MSGLEGKSFDAPDEVREFKANGRVELVQFDSGMVGKGTFEPGWKWSQDVKPLAGTDSCQVAHVGYVLSGRMTVRMDDGSEREYGPGEAFNMPPEAIRDHASRADLPVDEIIPVADTVVVHPDPEAASA